MPGGRGRTTAVFHQPSRSTWRQSPPKRRSRSSRLEIPCSGTSSAQRTTTPVGRTDARARTALVRVPARVAAGAGSLEDAASPARRRRPYARAAAERDRRSRDARGGWVVRLERREERDLATRPAVPDEPAATAVWAGRTRTGSSGSLAAGAPEPQERSRRDSSGRRTGTRRSGSRPHHRDSRGRPTDTRRPAAGSDVNTRRSRGHGPGGPCGRCIGSCTARWSEPPPPRRSRGPGRGSRRGSTAGATHSSG